MDENFKVGQKLRKIHGFYRLTPTSLHFYKVSRLITPHLSTVVESTVMKVFKNWLDNKYLFHVGMILPADGLYELMSSLRSTITAVLEYPKHLSPLEVRVFKREKTESKNHRSL